MQDQQKLIMISNSAFWVMVLLNIYLHSMVVKDRALNMKISIVPGCHMRGNLVMHFKYMGAYS